MRPIDWLALRRRFLRTSARQLHFEQLEDRQYLSISPWTSVAPSVIDPTKPTNVEAVNFNTYTLDTQSLHATLDGPAGGATAGDTRLAEIALPNPDGGLDWFSVASAPIMAPELAAEFPEIQTYRGQGITNPAETLAFDVTPAGFHAQVLSPGGSYYIDPYYHLDDTLYAVYGADNTYVVPNFTECLDPDCSCGDEKITDDTDATILTTDSAATTTAVEPASDLATLDDVSQSALTQSGSTLRTYRLAVAATGEYTAFQGGTVALGQAAIVTAVNRVSQIYETELCIRLQLVANNSQLVYTNASTDPYTNDNANSLLSQNQSNIDSVIGNANYDIGHVFSTGGGGLASLGVVGITGQKAEGETGSSAPTGDAFYVDYVAHEMGHQFGADHTFNGDSGSCSGSNRNGPTAYEPGSGSTIMAYAGICGNDDLQAHSDPYFHSDSLAVIVAYVDNSIPSVGTRTATGDAIPTVNAGIDYTIPAQTPFTLTARGSDANSGDVLTYDWEERDLGPQRDLSAADNGSSPLFRSFNPTTSPSRTFPRLPDLLNNTTTPGETMPALSRTMNFRVTVRDNRIDGAFNTDDMIVHVVNTGAAFAVTSPNTATNWAGGSTQTVTWNVAGTTANGINAANVNILLSTDGENTFTTVLAANTPNDGSQQIVVPNVSTSTARIRVEAVGNIFFDVSNANFTITQPISGIDLYGSAFSESPANLIGAGGLANVNFTVGNQGSTAAPAFDVKFYLSDDANIDPSSDILLTLDPSAAYYDASEPSAYHVTGGVAALGSVSAAIRVAVPVSDPFHTDNQYFIGMVVDADGNVAETDETNNRNRGDGADRQSVIYSSSFTNPASISIPDSGTATPYPSTINVAGLGGTIADVNVSLAGFTHTFPDDVDVLLVGPAGQKVVILSDVGGSNPVSGINLVLDDSAASSLSNTGQLTSGTFKPTNIGTSDTFASPAPASPYAATLSTFNNTNPNGTWSLYVVDDNSSDSGSFSGGWALTFVLNNTPPTNPSAVSLPAIVEDISAGSNSGRLVSSIVSSSGSTDADGNPLGIAITSLDNAHGQWQYSTDGGINWQNITSVSTTSALLLGPPNNVRFAPAADFNSQIAASPTFAFKAWDQTSGAAGGTGNTTTGTAYSASAAVATLPVSAVNDPPNFALAASNVNVNEDAGAVAVNNFATNMVPGPATAPDETGQALTFLVSVSGTTGTLAFQVAPSINPATGALTFTPAADTNGTATINVVLQDNGSGTPPNVNLSGAQQFMIQVAAVNDAPSFSLANTTVSANEDAGAVSVSGFASNIAPGPASATDESAQALAFLVSVSGTTGTLAFDVAPSVDSVTGDLSFTTSANTNGTATLNVVLQDNGSGTPPNVNQSPQQQFTINISPVNDEQVLAVDAGLNLNRGDTAVITTAMLETTDIDNSPAELSYTIDAPPAHGTILVNGTPAAQFTQEQINSALVSYQHDGTATLADSFAFTVDDGQGAPSMGTFAITIAPFAGDYNEDRTVEAGDYILWRKTQGDTGVAPYTGADGNGDGNITEPDYEVWRQNFGNAMPTAAAAAGVARPESATGVVPSHEAITPFAKPQGMLPESSKGFVQVSSSMQTLAHHSEQAATNEVVEEMPRDDALLALMNSLEGESPFNAFTTDGSNAADTFYNADNASSDALDIAFGGVASHVNAGS